MSAESKTEVQRGPRFPRYTLAEAITRVNRLAGEIKRSKVALETAVQALGYKSINGAALTTMATLNQYGLIDRSKNFVSVSPLALKILHPISEQQKHDALREAALRPVKFAEIFSSFPDCGESVIRSHLIQEDFSPETASLAASVYKANLDYANIKGGDNIRQDEEQPDSDMANNSRNDVAKGNLAGASSMTFTGAGTLTALKEFSFPLPDGMASLKVPFPLSEEGFETLLQTLAVFKPGMVKTETPLVNTGDENWEEQAAGLAEAGIAFNIVNFKYVHHIGFYNEITKLYELESSFDPAKGVAYLRPQKKS